MSLPNNLLSNYHKCTSSHCNDAGCRIKLDRLYSHHIIISGTKYQQCLGYSEPLCDFIVFDSDCSNELRVFTVELKGGNVELQDIRKAHTQLQNGASIVENMVGNTSVTAFYARLAKGKNVNVMVPKFLRLEKYKVRFRQFSVEIALIRCDSSLSI